MMNDKRFPTPVEVGDPANPRRIATAWEAIEWLSQLKIPSPGPRRYRSALRSCRDTLDGWVPPQRAWREVKALARELGQTGRAA